MAFPHRCTRCERRQTFKRKWTQYVRRKRCWFCGNTKWFLDKWMLRRGREQVCHCDGYSFPHRRRSKFCRENPAYMQHVETAWLAQENRWGGY